MAIRLVRPDEAEGPEVDASVLKLAHALLEKAAAGEISGIVVFIESEDSLDWDYAGEFDSYALATFSQRRISNLIDEMEDEGEEH